MSVQRAFADDVIKGYFDMGCAALERGQFAIAQKMFRAVFQEPSSKTQKEKIMLPLLIKSAQAHEGMKQLYKAKLLYIRALALIKKQNRQPDMQVVDLLLVLARINASQALYRQAMEFANEAMDSYQKCASKDAAAFVRALRILEQIMQTKGRFAEQKRLVLMLEQSRSEALGQMVAGTSAHIAAVGQVVFA